MSEARYKITADDRSNKAIRSAKQNLVAFRKSVLNVRTAMVALAGAAAMGAAIKKSADFGDSIAKSADVAGVTTGTLQELRFAFGQLAEITDQQVDLALQKFRRRLDLARDGSGAAVKTLEKLNISLDQDTGPALEETIDKLQRMSKTQDIAGEASQIFGEEIGPKLAAAIEKGNLDETRRMIHDIGGVLSDDAARGAEELNDEIDKLSRTFKTQFAEAILSNKEEIISFVQTIQEGMVEAIRWISRMQRQWEVAKFDERIEGIREQLDLLESGPTRARGDEFGKLVREYGSVEAAVVALREQLEEAKGQQQELLSGGVASPTPFTGGSGSSGSGGGSTVNRPTFGGATALTGGAGNPAGGPILAAEGFRRLGGEIADVREESDKLDQATNELNMTFTSAFEDAIVEGEKLRDVMRGLLQDITRIALRTTVTKPLGNALAGAIGGMFGGGGTHPAESADGNVFTRPGLTTISERGHPEAVLPLERSGGKLGVRASGGGGGGPRISIGSIDMRGADKGAVVRLEQMLQQVNASIEQRAVAAVAESRMRG